MYIYEHDYVETLQMLAITTRMVYLFHNSLLYVRSISLPNGKENAHASLEAVVLLPKTLNK